MDSRVKTHKLLTHYLKHKNREIFRHREIFSLKKKKPQRDTGELG